MGEAKPQFLRYAYGSLPGESCVVNSGNHGCIPGFHSHLQLTGGKLTRLLSVFKEGETQYGLKQKKNCKNYWAKAHLL